MKIEMQKILLFLLAGIWIEFNELPIIPLGFIIILLWIRPISFRRYKFLILAMILGFIGTGLSVKIFNEVTLNPETGREHHFSKYLFNLGLGTRNITQFINRDRITLYTDNLYQEEQKLLDLYLRSTVQAYNKNNNFVFSSMKKNYGEIEDMYYIGYLEGMIPYVNPMYLRFVYKVKFVQSPLWKTIHFHITFNNRKIKILKIEVKDEGVEYDRKTRRVNLTYWRSNR